VSIPHAAIQPSRRRNWTPWCLCCLFASILK
jgi:hypothetical protein